MKAHEVEAALDALVDASPSVAGTRAFLALRKAAIAVAKEADELRSAKPYARWVNRCVECDRTISKYCPKCKDEIADRTSIKSLGAVA